MIFRKVSDEQIRPRHGIGKVGRPNGLLHNHIQTIQAHALGEINLDTIREKIATNLYKELGRGLFEIPKTGLSSLPILNPFTQLNLLAQLCAQKGRTTNLRILPRFVSSYLDFQHISTCDVDDQRIPFVQHTKKHHRPPEQVLIPENVQVPLNGFYGVLVLGRVLAYGGRDGNAGLQWVRDAHGTVIGAQTVTIDTGCAFQFVTNENNGANWLVNTRKRRAFNQLGNQEDVQVANHNPDLSKTTRSTACLLLPNKSSSCNQDASTYLYILMSQHTSGTDR